MPIANTELGPTKMDLIVSAVQRELIESAVIAPRVLDVSQFAEPGLKSIEFPKATSFTISNRAEGVAGTTEQVDFTTDKMDLDFNAYVAWIVDYKSKLQSRVDVQIDLAARASRGHAKYLDQQIKGALETVGRATTTAGNLTYDVVLEMRELYRKSEGRIEASTLLIGPGQESELLNIDEFKRADVYGNAVIPTGALGQILGIPVVVSNLVDDDEFYLFDREAVAFGLQAGPSYSEQGANEFGSMAVRAVLDQIFGVMGLHLGLKGAGATESALVIKDNNA